MNFFILWGVDTILGIDIDWLWTFSVDFTFDICLIYTKFFMEICGKLLSYKVVSHLNFFFSRN